MRQSAYWQWMLTWGALSAASTVSLPAQMARLWTQDYEQGTRRVHLGRAVATDGKDGVLVTGTSTSASNGRDFLTRKYQLSTGQQVWVDRYNGTGGGDDEAYALAVDSAGDVIVVGSSLGPPGNGLDFMVRKLSGTDGKSLWLKRDNGTGSGDDIAYAVAVGPDDVVAVAGTSTGPGNNKKDFYTVKYNADGERQWLKRHNAAASGEDVALAVTVDRFGNVIATGYSQNASGDKDFYTAKYAGEDGSLVWAQRYNSQGSRDDVALAVAADRDGNVVVAGYSGATPGTETGSTFRVIKYAAADGSVIWNQADTGSGTGINVARAVAITEAGDVVAAGTVANVATGQDFRVRAYAAADGTPRWTHTDNGPGNGDDTATALALNVAGQVIVTGLSTGAEGTVDFLTRALDGATGQLLWNERYRAPGALGHRASPGGLALGPGGSVIVHGTALTAEAPEEGDGPSKFLTIMYVREDDRDADGLPDAWETAHWENTEAQTADDDPDGDGWNNLLEYALGLNPTVADAGQAPTPVVEEGFLTLTLPKKAGVTVRVQTSSSLTEWEADVEVLADDETTLKVRDTVPLEPQGPARFMRVVVTAP